jgi:predicted transcriptional regulator
MDIKLEKANLIKEIEKVNDISLIHALKSVLQYGLKKENISTNQYNKEIEEADAEIEAGNFLVHEAALKEIKSWREK